MSGLGAPQPVPGQLAGLGARKLGDMVEHITPVPVTALLGAVRRGRREHPHSTMNRSKRQLLLLTQSPDKFVETGLILHVPASVRDIHLTGERRQAVDQQI